jgi:VanZ family protein
MKTNLIFGIVFLVPGLYFFLVDKAYNFLGLVLVILGIVEMILALDRKIERRARK